MIAPSRMMENFRPLYILLAVFAGVVMAELVFLGVDFDDLTVFVHMVEMGIAKILGALTALAVISFVRLRSFAGLKQRMRQYALSETFFSGIIGAFLLMLLMIVFVINKCLIAHVNPYEQMQWDVTFAALDKALHFGRYPHEYLTVIADRWSYFSVLLDKAYASWMVILYIVVSYCLFCDRDFQRKMRFIWAYVLTFILLGAAFALYFSSTGPTFWAEFYKDVPNPYDGLMQHLAAQHEVHNIWIYGARHWMIGWTTNERLIDFNGIAAMPSLHNGAMLLMLFYMRLVSKRAFYILLVMAVLIFLATVYSGIHYAIDAYFAYVGVIAAWIAAHYIVKRLYPAYLGRELTI